MDILNARLPLSLVVACLGVAAGSGGTVAIAGAKVDAHAAQIQALEKETQASRERVLRIEVLSEQTNKVVERIERKLDRQVPR